MDLLLLQGRGFSFRLCVSTYVYLWARVTSCTTLPTPLYEEAEEGWRCGECHGSFVRAPSSRGCFVSVFFAPSRGTTVFCLRARKEAAKIGERGREGGREERERNKTAEDRKREMLRLSAKPECWALSCALKRFRQFGSCDTSSQNKSLLQGGSWWFFAHASISARHSKYPRI